MTCAEKLACAKAVNKPNEKNQPVMRTLLGHLNMGRSKNMMEQIARKVESRCSSQPTTTKLAAVPEELYSFLFRRNEKVQI